MNCFKKGSVLIGLIIFLMGCSSHYDSSGEQRYLSSRNGAQLVVPAPLTTTNLSYFYNLPSQNQDARISIQPPTV